MLVERTRPQVRVGCVGVLLGMVAALGVLVLVPVAWLLLPVHQGDAAPFPHAYEWPCYFLLAALWGIGAGLLGIAGLITALLGRRGRLDPVSRLLACLLAQLFAICWPVQLLVLAVACAARRKDWRRRYRFGVLVLGAALLLGGCGWGAQGYDAQVLGDPGQVSAATLQGEWRNAATGGVLELGAEGQFTAHGIPGNPSRRADGAGGWALADELGDRVVVLTPARGSAALASLRLYPMAFGPDLVLCPSDDPDGQCEGGFHR